jgi:hypothetical protein
MKQAAASAEWHAARDWVHCYRDTGRAYCRCLTRVGSSSLLPVPHTVQLTGAAPSYLVLSLRNIYIYATPLYA